MNPPDKPCQATPAGDLRQQIIDSRVPKNEREWWASREIEKLERELAAAKAECERLTANQRQPAEDIFVSHLCDELTRLRAELAIAENWVEHHSKHADDLIAENARLRALFPAILAALRNGGGCTTDVSVEFLECVPNEVASVVSRLRAEVERLNDCCDELHYIIDNGGYPSGKDYADMTARAEKAEAELAKRDSEYLRGTAMVAESASVWQSRAEKAEAAFADPHTLHAHCLRTLTEGQIAHLFGERMTAIVNRAEKAEAELADWSVLNLWGGTPDFIHEFIKGQQARIHRCQDLEADNAKWQKLLLMSRDDREIDLISEIEEQARLLGMSGEREADLLGKLGRLESELAAIKNGHGELGKYEQLRLKNAELHDIINRASTQFFHDGTDGETASKMLTVLNEAK
jgi:DNA repair exonuclease SbcCD ATPase subunit